MAQPKFKPGDKVQNLTRSAVVLTVVAVEGDKVRCETTIALPATPWAPAREMPLSWLVPAVLLTLYRPAPLPKVEPIATEIVAPERYRDLSEVEKLRLSYDGAIPPREMEAARRRDADRARAADYAHALATAAE